MDWKDEEIEEGRMAWAASGTANYCPSRAEVEATMTRAVELAAERGGTMTAERMNDARRYADALGERTALHEALDAIRALGARNAVLEAELALARKGFDADSPAGATIRALEKVRDNLCDRLFAANESARDLRERLSAAEEGTRELVRRAQHAESMAELREKDRDVWKRRLDSAAEELSDVGAGEVGRFDIVSRVRMLKARCATLSAAGQVLSDKDLECDHSHGGVNVRSDGVEFCIDCDEPIRWPCSPTCTHDDAATLGHPERLKERSERFAAEVNRRMEPIRTAFGDEQEKERCEAVLVSITRCPKCDGEVEEGYGQASGATQPAPYLYCLKSCGWRQTIKGEVVWNPTREQEAWFDSGAEAMRAACWEAVAIECDRLGLDIRVKERVKAVIEGAVP